jgi:hypothetical protein
MKSFSVALSKGEEGFAVHDSVYLSFHCEIISIRIGKEMSLLSVPDLIIDPGDPEVIGIREEESLYQSGFQEMGRSGQRALLS